MCGVDAKRRSASCGWATELAIETTNARPRRGWPTLDALQASLDLLQQQGLELVSAVNDAVLEARVEAYVEQALESADLAQVIYPGSWLACSRQRSDGGGTDADADRCGNPYRGACGEAAPEG